VLRDALLNKMTSLSIRTVVVLSTIGLSLSTIAPQFPISVINLDNDIARLASVSKVLEDAGVPLSSVQRLSAVHGASLSDEVIQENTTLLARLFATRGMIGCYLSRFFGRSPLPTFMI
jgi:hypothetical protein